MNKEEAKKWLEYHKQGIKPKRVKLSSLVYSDNSIAIPVSFKLHGYDLTLHPIDSTHRDVRWLEGFIPAFRCEVVSEEWAHRGGNNFDIPEALSRVLPLLGFNYRVAFEYEQWEEYDEGWIKVLSPAMSMYALSTYPDVPNKNIYDIVNAYELLSQRADKRSKKSVAIRNRLNEAIKLQEASRRYSFMSFYGILEIIADDLCAQKECPSGDEVAHEMAKFALANKGSQRAKLYFLLKAIMNDFDIDRCMELPDLRNDIAHGEQNVPPEPFELCKKLAFWASEQFALHLIGNSRGCQV